MDLSTPYHLSSRPQNSLKKKTVVELQALPPVFDSRPEVSHVVQVPSKIVPIPIRQHVITINHTLNRDNRVIKLAPVVDASFQLTLDRVHLLPNSNDPRSIVSERDANCFGTVQVGLYPAKKPGALTIAKLFAILIAGLTARPVLRVRRQARTLQVLRRDLV